MTAKVDDYPGIVGYLVGVVTFIGCWIYAIAAFGWFLGIGLGWLPSIFIALIAAYVWPLILLGIGGLFVLGWIGSL